MNIWVFIISIVIVSSMLVALNSENMYNYFTYVVPIKSFKISEVLSPHHLDVFKIGGDQRHPLPVKTIEHVTENNSITVTYGGGSSSSKHFGNIPDFAHVQNFNLNQTFVFRCAESAGFTFLEFYKYLGVYMIHDKPYIHLWHYGGKTQMPMPCNYSDVITHSVDLVDYDYASIIDAVSEHPSDFYEKHADL